MCAWPQVYGTNARLDRYFDVTHRKRFIRSGDFGVAASVFLTMLPVILRFLNQIVLAQVAGTDVEVLCRPMIAVLEVIEMLRATRVVDLVDPDELMRKIKNI